MFYGQGYSHDGCAINKCYLHDGRAEYQYYPQNVVLIAAVIRTTKKIYNL